MKSIPRILISGLIVTTLFSACSRNQEAQVAKAGSSESNPAAEVSPASNSVRDSGRQFVRTADMKFRVKNVAEATYQIETLTANAGGFVTHSGLNSITDDQSVTPLSADSSIESLKFTVTNDITLRVPNSRLDTTLKAIAALTEYLDHRNIDADDVALQIKANDLALRRSRQFNTPGQPRVTGQTAVGLQKDADDADIATLSLRDQISYSTITLSIYQRQETRTWVVANDKAQKPYQPGLASRLWSSIKAGWYLAEELLVLLTRLWLVFLVAILAYLLFKRYKKQGRIIPKA